MMDALTRLAPVALPLIQEADATISTFGAPANHQVLPLLGAVGTGPVGVVEYATELDPARLYAAGEGLRVRARTYGQQPLPPGVGWDGVAARDLAATLIALRQHEAGPGPESLVARLFATASYVEAVAGWQQGVRDDVARVLARVMTSGEAVTVRSVQARTGEHGALTAVVVAAAEIGAAVLRVAQESAARGRDVVRAWSGLGELLYRPPAHDGPESYGGPIRLS